MLRIGPPKVTAQNNEGAPKATAQNNEGPLVTPPKKEANNLGPLPESNSLNNMFKDPKYRSHVFYIKRRGEIVGIRKVAFKRDGDIFGSTITELKAYKKLIKKEGWKNYIMPYREGKQLDHGKTVYIDFDYVEGMDLIEFSKKASKADIYRIFADIAKALIFCFEAGITHGDIRGDNIYISKGGKVLLFDFGMATLDPKHKRQEDDLKFYVHLCKDLTKTTDDVDTGITPDVNIDLYERELIEIYRDMIAFWKAQKGGAKYGNRRTMKRQVKLRAKTRSRGKHN